MGAFWRERALSFSFSLSLSRALSLSISLARSLSLSLSLSLSEVRSARVRPKALAAGRSWTLPGEAPSHKQPVGEEVREHGIGSKK